MRTNQDLIEKVELIEKLLREVRISLEEREIEHLDSLPSRELEIGERVRILNPSLGQDSFGTVVKVNSETERVTVAGKRFGTAVKIVRHIKNVSRV